MCGLFGKRAASPNPRLPPQHHPNLQHHPWRSRWTLFLFTICPILLQGNNLNLLFREKLSLCCWNWQLYSTVQFVSNRCQGGGSDQNVLEIQKLFDFSSRFSFNFWLVSIFWKAGVWFSCDLLWDQLAFLRLVLKVLKILLHLVWDGGEEKEMDFAVDAEVEVGPTSCSASLLHCCILIDQLNV